MPKVTLRLRGLEDGQGKVTEHGSIEEAVLWLEKRPRFVEVLGVVFEGISREDNDRMKAAMRPLDEEEREKVRLLDEKDAAARERAAEARRRETEAATERMRQEAKNASPNRPMEVRYRFDEKELAKTDQYDDREITEAAKEAVRAWVDERQEWVKDRGQTIGEAKVTLYPNEVPAKKDRIIQGTFVPIAAAKSES
ncbi:MAG: hypothetical protein JNK04_24320 [Myxococcales bacterium]|nr:hypothetical protein [Myxococcales bacterium]